MTTELATNAPERRRIGAKDFASTFSTNITIQICTIVQAVFLARLLGPTGRGQFAAAILWPTTFAAIGGMGLDVALARRSATATDLARLARSGILLALCTGTIAMLCCGAALPWLMANVDEVSRSGAWYFLPYVLFNHIALALIAIDQGAGRFREFNLTRLILNPAYLVVVVCLWLSGTHEVRWFLLGLLFANGLVVATRLIFAGRNYSLIGPIEPIPNLIRQALPYGAANLISPLLQTADRALVLYVVGETQLGFYAVAQTASSVLNSLASSAGTVVFAIAAQEHQTGAFERVARMFRFTAWIWLLAGLCLAAAIPILLPLIYGSQYAPAIWPAIALIPGAAFAGQSSILEESMRAQGRAFIGLEARLVGMVVFLLMGWLLAVRCGVLGVTLAYVAAQLTALTIMLVAARLHFSQARFRRARTAHRRPSRFDSAIQDRAAQHSQTGAGQLAHDSSEIRRRSNWCEARLCRASDTRWRWHAGPILHRCMRFDRHRAGFFVAAAYAAVGNRFQRLYGRQLPASIVSRTRTFDIPTLRYAISSWRVRGGSEAIFRFDSAPQRSAGAGDGTGGFSAEATHVYSMLGEGGPYLKEAKRRGLTVVSEVYILLATEIFWPKSI